MLELAFFAVGIVSYIAGVFTGSYMHDKDFSDWGDKPDEHEHGIDAMSEIPEYLKRQAE